MTHGTILLKEENGDQDWWIHAYHDGHTWEAIHMLILLPWKIFECAKNPVFGMWFYDQYVRDQTMHRHRSYADMRNSYFNSIPLQTCGGSIANWIVWQQFSHWNIIERKNLPYLQDPDVVVEVKGHRNVSYKVSVAERLKGEIKDDGTEYWEENLQEIGDLIEKKNGELSVPQSKLYAAKEGGIVVRFDEIMVDLLWQANKSYSADDDPFSMAKRFPKKDSE